MNVLQDLRYGARMLRRSPAFTTVAVITLALGIGANTAVFSIVHAMVLSPLGYPDADRLVYVHSARPAMDWDESNVSVPDYHDWRQSTSFRSMGIYYGTSVNLSGGERPQHVRVARASASLLPTLGFEPARGRAFTDEEDRPGAPRVALLFDGYWRRQFGADEDVLGRTISLDHEPCTIIGVLPPEMDRAWRRGELWAPFAIGPTDRGRGSRGFEVIGRLADGVTIERASAELTAVAARLADEHPDTNRGWTIALMTLRDDLLGPPARLAIMSLVGAVLFVLLIACANVANLLLARGGARRREIAIRAALGAGRGRLVGQLLTESFVLALLGGALGVLLAMWGLELLVASLPENVPRLADIGVSRAVLLYTLGVSLLAAILFGLAPALRTAALNLSASIRDGGRALSAGGSRRRGRDLLVVGQIAMALVLVVCAGLMIRSFLGLQRIDPGFDPDRLLTARLALPSARYDTPERVRDFHGRCLERVRALPAVEGAAAVSTFPLGRANSSTSFTPDGSALPPDPDRTLYTGFVVVTPGYFETMRIALLAGRDFDDRDAPGAGDVAIVNRQLAARHWPGEEAVGKRLKFGDPDDEGDWLTVVGVVESVLHTGLDDTPRDETFVPFAQAPRREMGLVVRTAGPPAAATGAVCAAVWDVDPEQAVYDVRTGDDLVFRDIGSWRAYAGLLGVLGAVALVMAVVGLYGLIAYTVSQRTQEIGIRMALGARSADVLRLVMRRSVLLTALGVGGGIVLALGCAWGLRSIMFGVGPADPVTFAGVSLLLLVAAVLASWLPARRATRVDPMVALREP